VVQIQTSGQESAIPYVQSLLDAGIQPDICWRDAADGWWNQPTPWPFPEQPFLNITGFWEPDPAKFPDGFRPFGDWIRARGLQMLVWFEPERVSYTNATPNAYSQPVLATQHPDWLLPGGSHGSYFNLGNPTALAWLTDHLNQVVQTQKLDWYREDFNGAGPLKVWRNQDAREKERTSKSREGLTENFYIQGHLALWDSLRERNPHLRIDSCASGGRRNDLESMRRAVPLLRSDFELPEMKDVVEGNQGFTYGLSFWLPFYGGGSRFNDPYGYRSCYMPSFGMIRADMKTWKTAYDEARIVGPYILMGDYFPLTPYSIGKDQWIAWQFNRPEQGAGVVQAFRRGQCMESSVTLRLRGLAPSAQYEVTNFDGAGPMLSYGRDLMEKGLPVEIKDKPGAAVLTYRIAR
jgi:alpha-galactosidase